MKRPISDEQKSLFEATIAAEGVTTVIGNVGGTTFEDGGLAGTGANSFVSMLAVIHPGEAAVDSRDVTAFDDGTGEVTVATAFKGGQVAVGTPYKIVTFRFVPAEVAALLADIGDASASALGSLYAILGNPAQTFLAMIGYEGATALANKLTAARAVLLDQITAARMQELDGANIPADIDTLLTRLSAARALLLDEITAARLTELDPANIPADIDTLLTRVTAAVALASVCTEVRLAELAAANMPADIDTLLTRVTAAVALASVCTEVRLAELNAVNMPADIDTLLTRVTAAVALASALTTHDTDIKALLTTIAGYLTTEIADILTIVGNLPDGGALNDLAAILADTGTTIPGTITSLQGNVTTILGRVTAAVALASALATHEASQVTHRAVLVDIHDTDLPAVKTVVDAIPTEHYVERLVPIKMNCTQTITSGNADKDFIAANTTGASGLTGVFIDDAKVMGVSLLIIGRAVNIYAGTNALDCTTPAWNQWQIDLDNGGFGDLTNEEADGQMLDNDWRCPVEGAIHPFTLMFDVDTEITNIDGKIGVRLAGAQSEQDSLIVTCDIYLRILWKL